MRGLFTLIVFTFLSIPLWANNNKPEIYKRVNSQYNDQEIVIAVNPSTETITEFEGLPKEGEMNFGGVDVQIFKMSGDSLAYIQMGNKCAWTHFEDDDNINSVVRELIVVAYNN